MATKAVVKMFFCPYLTNSRLYNRIKIKKVPNCLTFLDVDPWKKVKKSLKSTSKEVKQIG